MTAIHAVPIANMIVTMMRDYCGQVGVEITEPSAPPDPRTEHADAFRRDRSNRFPIPTLFPLGHLFP
jgi:phosphopantetheinyl transferase